MKKPARANIEIRKNTDLGLWTATLGGVLIDASENKAELVKRQALWRSHDFKHCGQRSELFIKGANGKIQDKRTYGDDPRSIKG